ncbi:hypothetical protein [Aquimarina intermedia]|uniref:Uncharacterized protein n=1 Tax=Aquimarina intermedia TaxID=350814 RepID=A0A5S5BX69_9FLAO|nr:hypothetical protein [Aquimarina intermedia]TYP71559.1 hypothetical protein BD809_109141 [Aquimarina intermedia]
MTDRETKKFISIIFEKITSSNTNNDLIEIEKESFDRKYIMDSTSFPKIDFNISSTEIDELIKSNIIDKNYNLNPLSKNSDPLIKLLYSIIWKNGDLKKLKHITKGIHRDDLSIMEQEKSFVFYQFGKYLTKQENQPIIDQHVLRAFAIYQCDDIQEIRQIRGFKVITKKEKNLIKDYINWLSSDSINNTLKKEAEYLYYIDRILFASGRLTKKK